MLKYLLYRFLTTLLACLISISNFSRKRCNFPNDTDRSFTKILIKYKCPSALNFITQPYDNHQFQGPYWLINKTSYRKISWSLEAARFGFGLFQSPSNLTGTSAAGRYIGCFCEYLWENWPRPYTDVIMGAMASQITSLTIVNSTVYTGADKKNQSSASLAFCAGIHRSPVNSPHKWPVTGKIFSFEDIIML